jgi:hypothetical protein
MAVEQATQFRLDPRVESQIEVRTWDEVLAEAALTSVQCVWAEPSEVSLMRGKLTVVGL